MTPLAACSPGGDGNATVSANDSSGLNHHAHAAPVSTDSAATRGYKASMTSMMERSPAYTGDADRDFMLQMRVHHVAAITMSETLLTHGKDAETRRLAQDIIREQRREIAQIDAWLAQRSR